MADIFLSYAREDRQKAESIARVLQDAGWSVWWDRSILPGSSYEQVIEHEISAARCVVVLWSAEARRSNWVRDEATLALSRNVLVSVLNDDTQLPLGFRQQQTVNLASWNGSATDPEFQLLTQGIAKLVGGGGAAAEPPTRADAGTRRGNEPAAIRRGISSRAAAALAVVGCVLVGAVIWSAGYGRPQERAPNAGDPVAASTSSGVRDESTTRALVVPANAAVTLPRENVTLTVLSGQFQRLNTENRLLSLHIRFSNNGTRNFDRTYYTDLRLLVDGVPRAPTSAPLGQIEKQSASEFDYVFEVPATVTRAVLRVSRGDETSDIPLDFTGTRP